MIYWNICYLYNDYSNTVFCNIKVVIIFITYYYLTISESNDPFFL